MSDETHKEIKFPKIPDNIDVQMRDYLMELEKVLVDEFTGDKIIGGSITIGGDIIQ